MKRPAIPVPMLPKPDTLPLKKPLPAPMKGPVTPELKNPETSLLLTEPPVTLLKKPETSPLKLVLLPTELKKPDMSLPVFPKPESPIPTCGDRCPNGNEYFRHGCYDAHQPEWIFARTAFVGRASAWLIP